jgi:hypothetical protein
MKVGRQKCDSSTYILNGLVDLHHGGEAVLVGPGHPGEFFLLVFVFVNDVLVLSIIGLDFVDLQVK